MYTSNRIVVVMTCALLLAVVLVTRPVLACGGLFCQNSPVDQNAERIIFTQNADGTVSAIIQIQYTGFAPDFSWILPLPSPITAEDIEVPETGMQAFLELEQLTNVQIIPPPVPNDCAQVMAFAAPVEEGEVEVFASGEVGPFGFDVVGSEDPAAMIIWLRDHDYRVTEEMEPLIDVYVQEQSVFLAMRLLPDQGVQEIKPVKVTYKSTRPIIPLRLTAVAANPDMAVLTWFFADSQAVPVNYGHMEIDNNELRFFWPFGGNNYRQLIGEHADGFNGQAFITEFAGPSNSVAFSDPLLVGLAEEHEYLTRLNTVISPDEMTVDPEFEYTTSHPDVSNIRDLSDVKEDLYECERVDSARSIVEEVGGVISNLPFVGGGEDDDPSNSDQAGGSSTLPLTGLFAAVVVAVSVVGLVFVGVGFWLVRRSQRQGRADD